MLQEVGNCLETLANTRPMRMETAISQPFSVQWITGDGMEEASVESAFASPVQKVHILSKSLITVPRGTVARTIWTSARVHSKRSLDTRGTTNPLSGNGQTAMDLKSARWNRRQTLGLFVVKRSVENGLNTRIWDHTSTISLIKETAPKSYSAKMASALITMSAKRSI